MTSTFSDTQEQPMHSSPVAHTATRFQQGFWGARLQVMREQTLPALYEQMRQDGHFTAFREWHAEMQPFPSIFWESDISKWIGAASYSLACEPNAQLEQHVDEVIAFLLVLQQPSVFRAPGPLATRCRST